MTRTSVDVQSWERTRDRRTLWVVLVGFVGVAALAACSVISVTSLDTIHAGGKLCIVVTPALAKGNKIPQGLYCEQP